MFERWVEGGLLNVLEKNGSGCIAFSPLAQGMLTDKYLSGIPEGSRASKAHGFLKPHQITNDKIDKVKKLNEIAKKRGQSLAQMAITWLLKDSCLTSVLIGVSKVQQLDDCLISLNNLDFDKEELKEIEKILA